MTTPTAARWRQPSPARDPQGVRYGWLITCPGVHCDWTRTRADQPEDTDSGKTVLQALFDQHMDDEHPEHATYPAHDPSPRPAARCWCGRRMSTLPDSDGTGCAEHDQPTGGHR